MHAPPVSGGPVVSRVILVGQAPGAREPVEGRPFAWTAGRKLFRWIAQATGMDEAAARERIYFAAVCRCFPGKDHAGGDRVPTPAEVETCAPWLDREMALLRPDLLLLVGKLAILRFHPPAPLDRFVGRILPARIDGREVDTLPLPHPSGASPWPHREPGRSLLAKALQLMAEHPAMQAAVAGVPGSRKR
jgi:uracil-DNA glycosylase